MENGREQSIEIESEENKCGHDLLVDSELCIDGVPMQHCMECNVYFVSQEVYSKLSGDAGFVIAERTQ